MADDRDLLSVIRGLDSARRVGWAKYYEAVEGAGIDEAHRYDLELTAAGNLVWLLALTEHRDELANDRERWLATLVEIIRDNSDALIWAEMRFEYETVIKASGPTILAAISNGLAQPGDSRRAKAARFVEEERSKGD